MARILLVDDDDLARAGIRQTLIRAGHEVWDSASPKTALLMLDAVSMDIVITDIYMPGMNGVELIRRLGARESCRRVIAISGGSAGRSTTEVLAEARSVGADRSMEKPFSTERLLSAVKGLMAMDAASAPASSRSRARQAAVTRRVH